MIRRFLLALLCLLLPSFAVATTPPPPPTGIYIGNAAVPIITKNLQALALPYVDGIYLALNWSDIEPSRGVYNWTAVDTAIAQVAALGKKVQIGIAASRYSPTWATTGAASLTSVTTIGFGTSQTCPSITVPNSWDATYQTYWGELIAAFGAHYAGNPTINTVMFGGIHWNTAELMWPHFTGGTVGICQTSNDVAAALQAGATEENIFAAFKLFLNEYATAFPNTYIAIQGCGGGIVPPAVTAAVGPGGSSDPIGQYNCFQNMVPWGKSTLGSLFVVQVNDWHQTAFTGPYSDMSPVATHGLSGGTAAVQFASILSQNCPGSTNCNIYLTLQAMTQELFQYTSVKYVQVFPGDLLDPTLTSLWKRLETRLKRK